MASSSQTAPLKQDASYAQILEALAALQIEWHEHYAANSFFSAVGGSLDQPPSRAEPARHPRVS
jgi:hypothetical protein